MSHVNPLSGPSSDPAKNKERSAVNPSGFKEHMKVEKTDATDPENRKKRNKDPGEDFEEAKKNLEKETPRTPPPLSDKRSPLDLGDNSNSSYPSTRAPQSSSYTPISSSKSQGAPSDSSDETSEPDGLASTRILENSPSMSIHSIGKKEGKKREAAKQLPLEKTEGKLRFRNTQSKTPTLSGEKKPTPEFASLLEEKKDKPPTTKKTPLQKKSIQETLKKIELEKKPSLEKVEEEPTPLALSPLQPAKQSSSDVRSTSNESVVSINAPIGQILPIESLPEALISSAPLRPYTELNIEMMALITKMVGLITVMHTSGITTTTITLHDKAFEGSLFSGKSVTITLTSYDTARGELNIEFSGDPEVLALMQDHLPSLLAACKMGNRSFTINRCVFDLAHTAKKRKSKKDPKNNEDSTL